MARWSVPTWCIVIVAALAFTGDGTGLSGGRPALAQGAAPSGEGAKAPTRTIDEVRGLVAELEAQAERQRSQLRTAEASLRRARALLDELEGGRENHQEGRYHPRKTVLSPEDERSLPDQATAEKTEWTWAEDRATPQASARQLGDGYKLRISPTNDKPLSLTLTLTREGQTAYSWVGHEHSVFVRAGDVLYSADFSPWSTGCAVIAYEMKAGKLLWKTHLWGLPVSAHSKYRNCVNLEIDGRRLTVYGDESFGRYIELLDLRTGKTVGHRVVRGPISSR